MVSFAKDFFSYLLAQGIAIKLDIYEPWKRFSREKKALLLNIYQPLIITTLSFVSIRKSKNYNSIFFDLFFSIFKNSSCYSSLSKKKKEILSILNLMKQFLLKEKNPYVDRLKEVEKLFECFYKLYPFKNDLYCRDCIYLFVSVYNSYSSDKRLKSLRKRKKKLTTEETKTFLLNLLNEKENDLFELFCNKLNNEFLQIYDKGLHFCSTAEKKIELIE